ncbi:DUF6368 family protein [Allokutzneria sp. NRRL B-24872]|uniref:DUF6368 family protein n=1 Tax=Allokutzneria sp. NRRL B-24872 TaxID=1137961 RepID=UPI000A3A76FE|nr:DUF6368 family protein [Allokutzneria sp. NRRL B-24872]
MSGPTLVIELAEPLSPTALREFRALMVGLSSHFTEERPGFFDVNVPADRLGVEDRRGEDCRRPFLVYLTGPGVDEDLFEAEHADEPEAEAVLGFKPTHAVNVSAGCSSEIDHVATALLTAAVMDVIGGVANAELLDGQVSVVAGLPGVLGIVNDDRFALGTAEFLRAWIGHPAFRLLK